MKIKLVSDLHLEFSDIDIQNDQEYDVLILGGDICIAQDIHEYSEDGIKESSISSRSDRFRNFFMRCSSQFPHVIYIMGNHEFYNGKFHAGIDYMREECAKYPNVYMLENDTKIIDDIVFVGGTLWTDMNKRDPLTMRAIEGMMNDFRIIRNDKKDYSRLHALDVVIRHEKTLGYIEHIVQEYKDKKCVVVGHHSPSFQSVSKMYKDQKLMNGGFHSELSEFILDHPQIKLWTHGHTHQPFDYMIGETRIVCNPRGYESHSYSEDTGWNPNILLEI